MISGFILNHVTIAVNPGGITYTSWFCTGLRAWRARLKIGGLAYEKIL